MTGEKRFATPEEVRERQERIRQGIARMREQAAKKRAIFERWEAEGLIPRERHERRF